MKKIFALIICCAIALPFVSLETVTAAGTADDIISIAEGELGYRETGTNHVKYWDDLGASNMQGQSWCAAFIVWCARRCGIGSDIIPTSYSCYDASNSMKNWFEARGRYYTRGSTTPQRGDLVIFKYSSGGKHIGIVTGVSGDRIYTIEGNSSDQVKNNSYALTYSSIHGYCRPSYSDATPTLSVSDSIYALGDTITFNTNVANPSSYYLEIDRNGIHTWTENLPANLTFKPYAEGRYNIRLVSTDLSSASNWIEFNVCIGNRSVAGDFNGDGRDDYATLFDCGNNTAQWHVFLSTGTEFSEEIWKTDAEYYVSCAGGKVVAGDFNGDGLDDTAVIYKYTVHATSVHVFLSKGNGFEAWQTWFSDNVSYPSDSLIDRIAAGDFNGDGLDDIAAVYEYSKYNMSIHVFLSTGSKFQNWQTWFKDTSGYQANLVTGRVTAGDFNGDGLDDLAAMYEYEQFHTEIHVFLSTGTIFENWKSWFRDPSGYQAHLVSGRFAAGDFNGDGLDDIAAMYEYDAFEHSIHIFLSEKTQFKGWSSWISETAFMPANVSGRFVAGDFDGNELDDIATMYNYNNTYTNFHMYVSENEKLIHKWWNRIDNYNSARTTGFKNIAGSYTPSYTFIHRHTYRNVFTMPTCTSQGFTSHICTKGDNSYNDSYVDALGHKWGDWLISKQPTQNFEGEEKRICETCGAEETRKINPATTATPNQTAQPTSAPTATPTLPPTAAPTAPATDMPIPTATSTPVVTAVPVPTATPEPTAEPTATPIPTLAPTKAPANITRIRIKSQPSRTTVVEGTALDTSGLKVEAVYSDGKAEEITDYTLTGYDMNSVGPQTVTVEYMGFSASFNITVAAKSMIGIAITQKPDKRTYTQGESLDTAGIIVTAMYNNGTSEKISEYNVSGYDPNYVGNQTISVSYNGFSAAFSVTVSAKSEISGTVETPKLSINSFIGGKTVTLTCATDGASIYYTTDGSAPDENSTLYSEPITLTETATIKAVAVKSGMNPSKTAGGKITIGNTADPTSSRASGRVEVGTVITLRSETSGSMIYYTTDGSEPTTESQKYSGGIAITSDVTIKAIAVKDGYKNSGIFEASYTVPKIEPGSAAISLGSVSGAAGDTLSIPVYLFMDGESGINDYRFTLNYDASKFEYQSVTPAEGALASDLFTSASNGAVTVLYSGAAIESGEVCNINLKALENDEDGEYPISIAKDGVKIETESGNKFNIEITDGMITLTGSVNSNLELKSDVMLTDSSGNDITDKSSVKGEVTANVTLENANEDAALEPTTVNIIMAVYDREGCLVNISVMDADLSDLNYVFTNTVDIPEGVEVGSIKLMVWNGLSDMTPMSAASEIL